MPGSRHRGNTADQQASSTVWPVSPPDRQDPSPRPMPAILGEEMPAILGEEMPAILGEEMPFTALYLDDSFVAAACDKCAYATVVPTILMPFNGQPTRFILTRKCDLCYEKGTRAGIVTCTAVPLDSLMISGTLARRVVREQEWPDVCVKAYEPILLQRWMEADEEDKPASSMSELKARH